MIRYFPTQILSLFLRRKKKELSFESLDPVDHCLHKTTFNLINIIPEANTFEKYMY